MSSIKPQLWISTITSLYNGMHCTKQLKYLQVVRHRHYQHYQFWSSVRCALFSSKSSSDTVAGHSKHYFTQHLVRELNKLFRLLLCTWCVFKSRCFILSGCDSVVTLIAILLELCRTLCLLSGSRKIVSTFLKKWCCCIITILSFVLAYASNAADSDQVILITKL